MEWFRRILSMCGVRYVALVDFDGTRTLSRTRFKAGQAVATRMMGVEVVLLDEGKVRRGGGYVCGWLLYDPSAPRVYPRPPEASQ